MTTESHVKVAEMRASIIAQFNADPATASKLAHKIYQLLLKVDASAGVNLAFEKLPASAAGANSTGA